MAHPIPNIAGNSTAREPIAEDCGEWPVYLSVDKGADSQATSSRKVVFALLFLGHWSALHASVMDCSIRSKAKAKELARFSPKGFFHAYLAHISSAWILLLGRFNR